MQSQNNKIFDTDRRIKLGIWGLGRGQAFIHACQFLNIDVVAGCDYNEHMRKNFLKNCPDAFVTADEDEFLAQDFDAVLVATWFTAHAEHSIKALNAGKHVMCEVTSFFTPAEGVRLLEAVERSGKVYNLLENYPFTKDNLYIRKLWQEGFFGELAYAEYDYVHECRNLSYTYIDCVPVQPGYTAHNWRSWLDYHYYNTHSLGPVMQITGTRPLRVTALPTKIHLDGYLGDGRMGMIAPSLISMSNGGLVRNLMGSTTGDSHGRRLWGTKASVDLSDGIKIRVGGSGHGRRLNVTAQWDSLGSLADAAGHGGGDFWELYYFARQIFSGEKAPWDIYSACDVTLTGIMAVKSSEQNGIPVDIPDFRDPAQRERFRNDNFAQKHFDPNHIFPEKHDQAVTGKYSSVMSQMNSFSGHVGTNIVRNALDGMKIYSALSSDADRFAVLEDVRRLIAALPAIVENYRDAKKIADAYPDSLAGKAAGDLLNASCMEKIFDTEATLAELKNFMLTCDESN